MNQEEIKASNRDAGVPAADEPSAPAGSDPGRAMTIREWVLCGVLLLAGATLSVDRLVELSTGAGMCTTSGCEVVKGYVRFGRDWLVLLGAGFFWLLFLLAVFGSLFRREWIWHLMALVLLGAMAFDGSLLGYQFMGLEVMCWLCLGVGLALMLSLAGLAWVRRSWLVMALGIAVWSGGFAANSVLTVTRATPSVTETAFVSKEAENGAPQGDYTLFFSLHCGHCAQLMANIALNEPWSVNWHLSSIDSAEEDLKKLAPVVRGHKGANPQDNATNPFVSILDVKSRDEVPPGDVPGELAAATRRARTFFTNRGYRGVPLLLAREGPGKEVALEGTQAIAQYLWERGLLVKWLRAPEEAEGG